MYGPEKSISYIAALRNQNMSKYPLEPNIQSKTKSSGDPTPQNKGIRSASAA